MEHLNQQKPIIVIDKNILVCNFDELVKQLSSFPRMGCNEIDFLITIGTYRDHIQLRNDGCDKGGKKSMKFRYIYLVIHVTICFEAATYKLFLFESINHEFEAL